MVFGHQCCLFPFSLMPSFKKLRQLDKVHTKNELVLSPLRCCWSNHDTSCAQIRERVSWSREQFERDACRGFHLGVYSAALGPLGPQPGKHHELWKWYVIWQFCKQQPKLKTDSLDGSKNEFYPKKQRPQFCCTPGCPLGGCFSENWICDFPLVTWSFLDLPQVCLTYNWMNCPTAS